MDATCKFVVMVSVAQKVIAEERRQSDEATIFYLTVVTRCGKREGRTNQRTEQTRRGGRVSASTYLYVDRSRRIARVLQEIRKKKKSSSGSFAGR